MHRPPLAIRYALVFVLLFSAAGPAAAQTSAESDFIPVTDARLLWRAVAARTGRTDRRDRRT